MQNDNTEFTVFDLDKNILNKIKTYTRGSILKEFNRLLIRDGVLLYCIVYRPKSKEFIHKTKPVDPELLARIRADVKYKKQSKKALSKSEVEFLKDCDVAPLTFADRYRAALRERIKASGLKLHKFGPQVLRASILRDLLRNDAPIQAVAEFAGHSSLQSTMEYVDPIQKIDLKKIHNKFHPKS